MAKQDCEQIGNERQLAEQRAAYVPPKVEVMPLEEIVKSGVTFSADGPTWPGRT